MGSIENQRALKMSLVAQVAQSYFELVALDNELSIVKKTVDAAGKVCTWHVSATKED